MSEGGEKEEERTRSTHSKTSKPKRNRFFIFFSKVQDHKGLDGGMEVEGR